jgi:hypothetical protein
MSEDPTSREGRTMIRPDIDPRVDRDLVEVLSDLLAATDPVPARVLAAARAAVSWLTLDAELAALTEDSALSSGAIRGTTAIRSLTFECDAGVVVLDVTADGDGSRILGQTDRPADVEIRHHGPTINVSTDDHGRFRARNVSAGPVSLRCVFHDSPTAPIVTSWVVV